MKHWDKYDIGGSIESELEAFDVSKLDAFEQMQYSDFIKHSTKVEALKILINNVEGDFSQLSPNLNDIAEMYYPVEDNYFMDDNYADGGVVKYYTQENERLSRPSGSIEREILAKVEGRFEPNQFVGNFGWKTPQGKLADGYLYNLDDFDKSIITQVKLKDGESLFRYFNRTSAIGGMTPMIKINLNKGLLYFGVENENDDIVFETRGVNALYIGLIEKKYKNGGGIKTDFNDLNNEGLRKALISFREDFNNFLSNYLQVGKENYILSNIDNVMVIFRDKSLGDFSDVENVAINKWIQPYFDISKKPLIAEYLNGYKIDGNRIIIYIKDSQMYANGGGIEKGEEKINKTIYEVKPYTVYQDEWGDNVRKYSPKIITDSLAESEKLVLSNNNKALVTIKRYNKDGKAVKKGDTIENISTYGVVIDSVYGGNAYITIKGGEFVNESFDVNDLVTSKNASYSDDGSKNYWILDSSNKNTMANGGGVSDLQFTSKTLTKSKESKLKEKLFDGRISEVDLKNIIGFEPNYPTQIVGTIKLEKCFLLPYYKII